MDRRRPERTLRPALRWVVAAALIAAAFAAFPVVAADSPVEGGQKVYAPLFSGRDPTSEFVGSPRPEAAAPCENESVHEGLFAPRKRPRLLDRLLPDRDCRVHVERENWLRRPLSVTWFVGGMAGCPLVHDWVRGDTGVFGGLRVGWDFDPYWGAEFRLAFGTLGLIDSDRAIEAQHWYDALNGFNQGDPFWHRREGTRNADLMLYDLNMLYYPWGDTPLRPYVSVGLGGTRLSFIDRLGDNYDTTLLTMPLAIGVKYHWTDWLALRFEVTDNIAFGTEHVETLHNVSIVGAVEMRFGGSHRSYWPWTPGRKSW